MTYQVCNTLVAYHRVVGNVMLHGDVAIIRVSVTNVEHSSLPQQAEGLVWRVAALLVLLAACCSPASNA